MKTLATQISKLLFEHDCVIVPGLGGFITNYKPAVIHPQHHTFYPPSKQIIFNVALNTNDGILINAYTCILGIDFQDAKKIIDQKVQAIRIELLKGHKVLLEDIGYLSLNKENSIEFHPANSVNYLGEAYGLGKFDFTPVNRQSNAPIIGISRPVVRKTMRWAAIIAPIAALALWTTFNTGTLNRIYSNYASLIPTNTESTKYIPSTPIDHSAKTTTLDVSKVVPAQENAVITSENTVDNSASVSTPGMNESQTTAQGVMNREIIDAEAVSNSRYHIIAGAFSVPENAERYVEELKSQGYKASMIGRNRKNLHMVSIQSFNDQASASARMYDLHRNGFPAAWILEKAN